MILAWTSIHNIAQRVFPNSLLRFLQNDLKKLSNQRLQNLCMNIQYCPPVDDPLFRPIFLAGLDPKFGHAEEFETSVTGLVDKMKEFEIELFYVRVETPRVRKYVKKTSRNSAPSSGGRDVYRCRHYKKDSALSNKPIRVGEKTEIHCPASFTVHYPYGYIHENIPGVGKKINIRDHGDLRVRVSWRSKHNHVFNSSTEFATTNLSREAYNSLESLISIGFRWKQIGLLQARELDKKHPFQQEISKVTRESVRNLIRKLEFPSYLDGKSVQDNIHTIITSIRASGGFAEFTEVFFSLDDPREKLDKYVTPKKHRVYSLVFMTAWQKHMLKRNSRVFYLDSTHNTCTGLHKNEDAFLFTIYVKNQTTGQGAPAAFMLTNAERGPVVADFLEKIKDFSQMNPSQVIIDFSEAKKVAIKYVWKNKVSIVFCQFHVRRAFEKYLHSKIHSSDKADVIAHAKNDFFEIINCKNMSEADEKIRFFLIEFSSHTDLINYVKDEWFSQKHLIINERYETFAEQVITNNPIEPFYSVLEKNGLGQPRRLKTDVWFFKLLDQVLPLYSAKERGTCLMRTHNQAEIIQLNKVNEIQTERLMTLATLTGTGQFVIKSFTKNYKTYGVNLWLAGSEKDTCTCSSFNNSGSWCKHLFAAQKWWKIHLRLASEDVNIIIQRSSDESAIYPALDFVNEVVDGGLIVDDWDEFTPLSTNGEIIRSCTENVKHDESYDSGGVGRREVSNGIDVEGLHQVYEFCENPGSTRSMEGLPQINHVSEPIDFSRQNIIRSNLLENRKRLYREKVDEQWDEIGQKLRRVRDSISHNDQRMAFSLAYISWAEDHIKKYENPCYE